MRRSVAVTWHASFSLVAAVLYFFFVLPRWFELTGETPHVLGTVLRIVTGALIGLAALPVVFTLLRTRRPEFGTPALALTLRTVSIALHVLAGVLIIGTAISEIWLNLDTAGQWLFGIYGAAAAVAVLGIGAFYLAFVAELPPPPPKPLRPKTNTRRPAPERATEEERPADDTATEDVTESSAEAGTPDTDDDAPANTDADDSEQQGGKLRNHRPAGKSSAERRRRRSRGGVAVED